MTYYVTGGMSNRTRCTS